MIRLLIVDDEPSVLSALRRELRAHFANELIVQTCDDPVHALQLARATPFDIVMSDLRMPEIDGLAFLSLVSAVTPASLRIVLTGSADFETAQRAINDAGVFRYLTKPWSQADLRSHLTAAIQSCRNATVSAQELSVQDIERRRLETLEPGLTQVDWGPNGEVMMPSATDLGNLGSD
jgi:two-component system probable response regulator PhcQ